MQRRELLHFHRTQLPATEITIRACRTLHNSGLSIVALWKAFHNRKNRMCCNFVVEPKGESMIGNLTRYSEQAENEAVQ